MLNTAYKVLSSDADIFAAALAQVKVYVVQLIEGKPHVIADYAGPVQKWTPEYVLLAGMTYRRDEFEFRVRLPKK
ncbi:MULTISPECIES: hypothetical protein [Paenibacillus]|jgi:hypothetical protein|uniref:hypothetical protein n=1 Tax=Paenibacillus TaxID=44249 RepID=UPI000A8807AB|nr:MULTISPECIES: hypothetical protein [unclassified Paenibacillus]